MENQLTTESKFNPSTYTRIVSSFCSRVFKGKSFVEAYNFLKTTRISHACNLLINTARTKRPPKLLDPTEMLIKKWVPVTSMFIGLASVAISQHDDVNKIAKNIVHKPLFMSNDHNLSYSSSKIFFNGCVNGDKSMQTLKSGIEENAFPATSSIAEFEPGSGHMTTRSQGKSYFQLHIDPLDWSDVDDWGDLQEDNTNEVMKFAPIMKDANIYPSNAFLSICYSCKKKLDQTRDIFIYRGDKAFCTEECRERQIHFDKIKLKQNKKMVIEKATKERSSMIPDVANNNIFFLS